MSIFSFILTCGISWAVAQSGNDITSAESSSSTPQGDYEARPSLGLMVAYSPISSPTYTFRVDTTFENYKLSSHTSTPIYGVGGNLPFNNYFGLNGLVGYQMHEFTFDRINNDTTAKAQYNPKASHIIAQAGLEGSYPIKASYEDQTALFAFAFASGIGGKVLLGDSKFKNGELWGYALGAGLRYSWQSWGIVAGVRYAASSWELTYDAQNRKIGKSDEDYKWKMSYQGPVSPYIGITLALY